MADDLAYVPDNPDDFRAWGFVNAAQHRDFIRVLFANTVAEVAITAVSYTSATGALTVTAAQALFFNTGANFTISGITGGTGGGTYTGLNGTWHADNSPVGSNMVTTVVTAGLGTITTVTGTPVVAGVAPMLSEYVLDPFDPENLGNWPWLHQTMHREAWQAVGGAGYDLTGIDWQDQRTMALWIALHNDEHERLNTILGL